MKSLFFYFLISIALNLLIIKYILPLEKKSRKENHHIHTKPASRLGGLAIWLTLFLYFIFNKTNEKTICLFMFSTTIFLIGIFEDLYRRTPSYFRFIIISFVSFIFILIFDNMIIYDLGIIKLPSYLAQFFTIFALTGITNAFNIIDGVNGLSSFIAIISLFFVNLVLKEGTNILINSNLIETTIFIISAFSITNLIIKKIFLGDGGAYFIGFLVGIALINTSNVNKDISPWFFLNIVSYPVIDTIFSMWRRKFLQNRGIMQSDLLHLHTLLCKRILKSHFNTTFLIVFFSLLFSTVSYLFRENTIILIFIFILFSIIYAQSYFYIIKKFSKSFGKI